MSSPIGPLRGGEGRLAYDKSPGRRCCKLYGRVGMLTMALEVTEDSVEEE